MLNKENVFKNKKYLPPLAISAVFLWGCAYPLIKLGFEQFRIDSANTGGKALFAGVRFLLAGLAVLFAAARSKASFKLNKKNALLLILFGLVNTALHYFCFYLGMSHSPGSRASVIDALGTFLLVICACAFFKEEHMSAKKLAGCAAGFSGLLILNWGGGFSGISLLGDGMMVLNACFAALGGIMTRIVCKKIDPLFATGAGLAAGGVILIIAGIAMGGGFGRITAFGVFILTFLAVISAVGFSIYNQLMKYHSVGRVAIYNSLIPVFGVMLSCIFLGEVFSVKYLFALVFVAAGVIIIEKE